MNFPTSLGSVQGNNIQAQQIQQIQQSLKNTATNFSDVFDQSMVAANAGMTYQAEFEKKKKELSINSQYVSASDYFNESKILLAQAQEGVPIDATAAPASSAPVQLVFNKLIDNLNEISQQEIKVNYLLEAFTRGEVTEDEVVFETAKLNLIMSMVTTVVQNSVQTFKEILQIPV